MERSNWLGRKRLSLAVAEKAKSSEAQPIDGHRAGLHGKLRINPPISDWHDGAYYAALEQGAVYLAGQATDPAESAGHLKAAAVYRDRALEASSPPSPGTIH